MLNELYILVRSLERCGLIAPSFHPSIKRNSKQSGFVVGIAEDGTVGSVEFRDKEKMSATWRIESGSNGVSFPGFNLVGPIWSPPIDSEEVISQLVSLSEKDIPARVKLLEGIAKKLLWPIQSHK